MLVSYFEDEDLKDLVAETLKWWDEQIFPKKPADLKTGDNLSRMARIKLQHMAKEAAALEGTNNKQPDHRQESDHTNDQEDGEQEREVSKWRR
ncbi:hypothetical protein M422DRAFT_248651 [Sphaerobolus stellatus SS14]|nr:hypothetical protein M422DRAFT_248651 [Sphaerobolus stellatus SS14]